LPSDRYDWLFTRADRALKGLPLIVNGSPDEPF
jgi:hypothetical protein